MTHRDSKRPHFRTWASSTILTAIVGLATAGPVMGQDIDPAVIAQDHLVQLLETADQLENYAMVLRGDAVVTEYDGPLHPLEMAGLFSRDIHAVWYIAKTGDIRYQAYTSKTDDEPDKTYVSEWLEIGDQVKHRTIKIHADGLVTNKWTEFPEILGGPPPGTSPETWISKPADQPTDDYRDRVMLTMQAPHFKFGESFFNRRPLGAYQTFKLPTLPPEYANHLDDDGRYITAQWGETEVVFDAESGDRPIVFNKSPQVVRDPGFPAFETTYLTWQPSKRFAWLPATMQLKWCDGEYETGKITTSIQWLSLPIPIDPTDKRIWLTIGKSGRPFKL